MKDLISVETGRYVNVQSMIFKFVYERSPLFTEQVLVIPIILVFFGEYLLLYMWVIFSSVSNSVSSISVTIFLCDFYDRAEYLMRVTLFTTMNI